MVDSSSSEHFLLSFPLSESLASPLSHLFDVSDASSDFEFSIGAADDLASFGSKNL